MKYKVDIKMCSDRIYFLTPRTSYLFFPEDVVRVNKLSISELKTSTGEMSGLSYFTNNQIYLAELVELCPKTNLQLLRINKRAHISKVRFDKKR